MFLNSSNFSDRKALRSLGLCLFVASGFFAAQLGLLFVLGVLIRLKAITPSDLDKPVSQLLLLAAAYSLALLAVVFLPRLFNPGAKENLRKALAVARRPHVSDVGLVVLGYGAYLVLTVALGVLVQALWRDFNAGQLQESGFQHLSGSFEFAAAFLALVIIAPLAEELLFRGYLFGKLRESAGFWLSALLTSALFGAVHLQWNVGLDVFALSLVLCYLREKTGVLWGCIGLHMLKNSIAFLLLFVYPDLLKGLI